MKSLPARRLVREATSAHVQPATAFALIGGFLGAGKTTCIGALVRQFQADGKTVGVITNDQGAGLIDTESALERLGVAVGEITGGCFCCRADQLVAKLQELQARAVKPDVILAEPVGSCTDLMATVLLPLERIYKLPLRLAPLSVVADARRLHRLWFGGRTVRKGEAFSRDVRYIFLKQVEEAQLVVLNKQDLLTPAEFEKVQRKIERDWPGKVVCPASAVRGAGIARWMELITGTVSLAGPIMEMDYDRYGHGESLLGWYNAELTCAARGEGVDGNRLLVRVAREIQADLEAAGVQLAHFKMSLAGKDGEGKPAGLAVVNAVSNGTPAMLSRQLERRISRGRMLVNLRAEGAPEILAAAVTRCLDRKRRTLALEWKAQAAFRPGQPRPTHRVSAA